MYQLNLSEAELQQEYQKLQDIYTANFIGQDEFTKRLNELKDVGLQALNTPPSPALQTLPDVKTENQVYEEAKVENTSKTNLPQEEIHCVSVPKLDLPRDKARDISKSLSYILRHGLQKIDHDSDGFVSIEILSKRFRQYKPEEILFVASTSQQYHQNRYAVKQSKGTYFIKAVQPVTTKSAVGIKNWMGFPIHNIRRLREAAHVLQYKFKKPHMSLGWCKTTSEFLSSAPCANLTEQLKNIVTQMQRELSLNFVGFEVIGKENNKIVAVYKPFLRSGKEDTTRYLQFHQKMLDLWRNAAKAFASRKSLDFKMYKNQVGSLEYAETSEGKIYEMKAINPKFHVTIGIGTDAGKLKGWSFPSLEFNARQVYISQGSETAM